MVEALLEGLAGGLGQLRRLPVLAEVVADDLEHLSPGDAGADGRDRAVERVAAEGVPFADLRGGLAHDEGARHVSEASALAIPRPEVDHDGHAGLDRAGAAIVPARRLRAARDDRLLASHRMRLEPVVDRRLESLARDR